MGVFAAAGCGKTTLLGMLARGCEADVIVIGLPRPRQARAAAHGFADALRPRSA